ncbi:hypothetical protein L7F22_041283 [Adiantum nelumboides]|nr:hypothetical protein [Adiantum nelumboides]
MALSLFGRGRRDSDPFDSFLFDPFALTSSFLRFPDQHSSFARDVAAVANTQVDWKETSDSHIFKANLPGLAKQDVKVLVEDGHILQISGERKKEETTSSERWHRVERTQGSFLRRFRLPDNAKVEDVKAAMENGVLTITIPKLASTEHQGAIRSVEISG